VSATVRAALHQYAVIEARSSIDSLLCEKIDLDRAFKSLIEKRMLSDMERQVLAIASLGHSKSSGSKELHISRWAYSHLLNSACRKIADFLGWEYSDRQTIQTIRNKLGRELTRK
jgi:DNA-binding CsgD family transcriptional regulator